MMKNNKVDIKNIFGARVKEARKNKGFSQEKFAEMIGIGTSTLSKIECGKSYPTPETIDKIILNLEIEPYLLFMNYDEISLEKAHQAILNKIDKLKNNQKLLKTIYDFIMFLDAK